MTKTGILETISYKTKRVKFANSWLPVDPFLDLDSLEFNGTYTAELDIDKGTWYIKKFEKAVAEK